MTIMNEHGGSHYRWTVTVTIKHQYEIINSP